MRMFCDLFYVHDRLNESSDLRRQSGEVKHEISGTARINRSFERWLDGGREEQTDGWTDARIDERTARHIILYNPPEVPVISIALRFLPFITVTVNLPAVGK